MGATKEWFCRISESVYNEIPSELRMRFDSATILEVNEYEIHKNDPHYLSLYKAEKKAKDNLRNYLFDKRHKN